MHHKYFVFAEGLKLGVPLWILFWHDWDKLLPDEFIPYARCFYKPDGTGQYLESTAFARAWMLHQHRNNHHWQYWLLTLDSGETKALHMPEVYRLEMMADWHGAGRAYKKPEDGAWTPQDTVDWYEKGKATKQLHPMTRMWVEADLIEYADFAAKEKTHETITGS